MDKIIRLVLVLSVVIALIVGLLYVFGLSSAAVLLAPLAALGVKSVLSGSDFNLVLYVLHGSTYTWWYDMTRGRDFSPVQAKKERELYYSGRGPELVELKKSYRALPRSSEFSAQ